MSLLKFLKGKSDVYKKLICTESVFSIAKISFVIVDIVSGKKHIECCLVGPRLRLVSLTHFDHCDDAYHCR